MKSKRYDHAISFNFTLKTDSEEPSGREILDALKKALDNLSEDSIHDAVEIFDSYDNQEEEE